MKKTLFVFVLLVLSNISFGQVAKDVIAKPFDKSSANAKLEVPTKDVVAPKPDATRAECCLNFDNYTGYWLEVWVDGTYRGSVAPWDDDYVCVENGWTTYYVRTAGSTYEWSGEGVCREFINLKLM